MNIAEFWQRERGYVTSEEKPKPKPKSEVDKLKDKLSIANEKIEQQQKDIEKLVKEKNELQRILFEIRKHAQIQ